MGYTTEKEVEEEFYLTNFSALVNILKDKSSKQKNAGKLFLEGCIDGAVLATRAIPPFKSSTLNEFVPMHVSQWDQILHEQEKEALLGNAVIKPYQTGYCIGFLVEAFVRGDGVIFSEDAFASHVQTIAKVVSLTPPQILNREVFYRFARDIHYHLEKKVTIVRRDAFIETLLK